MNELIKQLAHHAWVDNDQLDACGYTDLQKFAELIVRECCDIFVELRTRPADLAVKDVKQHFGVE